MKYSVSYLGNKLMTEDEKDKWNETSVENWEEYYQPSIDKAMAGNFEEGRWLFRDALDYLKRNHSMPDILRLYLVEIMQKALKHDSKQMSKHLNITKPNHPPAGKDKKKHYVIAQNIYIKNKNKEDTLPNLILDASLETNKSVRTVERIYKKYLEHVKLADEFKDLTKYK